MFLLLDKVKVKVAQLCLTLCDPMAYTVMAFPFSRGTSQPRDWTQASCLAGRFFTSWATREAFWQSSIRNIRCFPFIFTLIGSCWSQSSSITCLQNPKVCVADRQKSLSQGFLQKCPCLPYQSVEGKTRDIRFLCRKQGDGEGRRSLVQGYLKQCNLGDRGERYLVTNDCTFCWAGNMYSSFVTIIVSESESDVAQSCPTLCDPMDCSLPGFSIHGIFQASVL